MQLPWRRAPRAALTGPLTVLVTMVAAMVLSFVAAAVVLHNGSSAGAALAYQESRLCEQGLGPQFDLWGSEYPAAQSMLSSARGEGANNGFPDMITGMYGPVNRTEFNGVSPFARFGYRDHAFDNLKVLQGGSRDGLWVPRSVAETTHLKLGDRGEHGKLPPVTAIYEDLTEDTTEFWCTERTAVVVPSLSRDGTGPIIFVPSLSVLHTLVGDHATMTATARYQLQPPATTAAAQDLVNRGTRAMRVLKAQFSASNFQATEALARPLEIAEQAEVKVRDSTLPLTLISLVVGLVGLAAVAVQWCQRRQAELRLLWTRGASPLALGARAVLELAAPLVLGSGAGLLLAWLLRGWYAPEGTLPEDTAASVAILVAAVTVAGLLVITATAAVRGRQLFESRRSPLGRALRLLRFVPWELLTATLAFLSWQRMVPRPTRPPQGEVLIAADATGLAFPLLVVVTAALVLARIARLALTVSHRARWRWTPGHLALRRLAAARGAAVGVLVVGVLAVGTLTVGSGIAGAQQAALHTKGGMLIGANTVVTVPLETGVDPKRLSEDTTVVGIIDDPGRTTLVIDPATFAGAAALPEDDGRLEGLLTALPQGDGHNALRVNRSPKGRVPITFQDNATTIGYAYAFPYIGTKPGYVVPRSAVLNLREIGLWQVWSPRPLPDVLHDLDAAGIEHLGARTADTSLDGLPFLTVTWTFTFVAALGLVLAVVAAVALVLAVEVRRRQNALSGALATRMGLGRRTLVASHALELGSLAGLATTAGCATGLVTTGVSIPLFDPAPWLRPITAIPQMVPMVATTYLATAAVVAMVCWTSVRSVRTARMAELVRG